MAKPEPKARMEIEPERAMSAPSAPAHPVAPSLDRLEERVKLLLARYAELIERYREAAAVQQTIEGGLDPIELHARVQSLESENDRLVRHAAYLEDRIRDLMIRVRYVVETR